MTNPIRDTWWCSLINAGNNDLPASHTSFGKTLNLNGEGYEVVGILPPSYSLPNPDAELAIPLAPHVDPLRTVRGSVNFLRAIGRLKRLALGAQRTEVFRLVLRHGVKVVSFGLVLGLAGALALTRVLSGLLFGVTPSDPMTFVFVSLTIIVITLVACSIPARRATKVDPLIALRNE